MDAKTDDTFRVPYLIKDVLKNWEMHVTTYGYSHPRSVVISLSAPGETVSGSVSASEEVALVCATTDAVIGGGERRSGVTLGFEVRGRTDASANVLLRSKTKLATRAVYGVLGVVEVDGDVFVGTVLERVCVGAIAGVSIYRITRVGFFSLTLGEYDDADLFDGTFQAAQTSQASHGSGTTQTLSGFMRMAQDKINQAANKDTDQDVPPHPCAPLIKLFSAGSFYFAPGSDLTRSVHARTSIPQDPSLSPFETADPQFFWNASILASLLSMRSLELPPHHRASLDASHMLIQAIQGFAGVQPVNPRLNLSIVSRLSCRNAGTRFNARGIDDEGECGNFVETEFALEMPQSGFLASFIMVRGSVPVFWEQTGVQMTHRVEFSRGFEATALAFDRHFQNLRERYGDVHIVNLLSTKEGSAEQSLSRQYNGHVNEYSHGLVHYTAFDYHEYVKQSGHDRGAAAILQYIQGDVDAWGYTLVDTKTPTMAAPPLLSQQGVMRVNCLDCLDRTNHIQYILARTVAERCLREMEQAGVLGSDAFADAFQNLWADNGDWLSKIYTGTGALKSSLTRKGKQTFAGFLDDAAKSVNRFFINNFQDKRRQEAIDLVLGKIRPHRSLLILNTVSSQVEQQLTSRRAEFAKMEEVTIFIGTWNVNGCLPGSEPLQFWIQSNAAFLPNLIVIGIQELIELKAQEIVTANTDSLCALWNDALMATLNGLSDTARYVPLRSVHLMALGLFVYVREDCVTKVRGVEVASCKTGFAGIAANKGGIGLSCLYQDTSMVFITAHFAAGDKNAEDRNEDYRIISNGLVFKRKSLAEHNMVFWLGDFNYRVAIPNEEARSIIDQGRYPELLAYDQLKYWQDRGSVFDHFTEGPIHFPPTYKYDNGTNIYDSSEKARCPSWTDRVLYRGKNLQLLEYTNVDSLLKSDHRPVRAIFQAQVEIIDVVTRNNIKSAISQNSTPFVTSSPHYHDRPAIAQQSAAPPLIDFSEESSSAAAWATLITAFPAGGGLFPGGGNPIPVQVNSSNPSAPTQWWQVPVDETWILDEGDATNPFVAVNQF